MRTQAEVRQAARERRETMQALKAGGATKAEIGKLYGISAEAVHQILRDTEAPEMAACWYCGEQFLRKPWQRKKPDSTCPACLNEKQRVYRLTSEYRERSQKRSAALAGDARVNAIYRRNGAIARLRHPEKCKARSMVGAALRRGELQRPTVCERCGKEPPLSPAGRSRIHAHHSDYSKLLDVEWVCLDCHRMEHLRFPPPGADR